MVEVLDDPHPRWEVLQRLMSRIHSDKVCRRLGSEITILSPFLQMTWEWNTSRYRERLEVNTSICPYQCYLDRLKCQRKPTTAHVPSIFGRKMSSVVAKKEQNRRITATRCTILSFLLASTSSDFRNSLRWLDHWQFQAHRKSHHPAICIKHGWLLDGWESLSSSFYGSPLNIMNLFRDDEYPTFCRSLHSSLDSIGKFQPQRMIPSIDWFCWEQSTRKILEIHGKIWLKIFRCSDFPIWKSSTQWSRDSSSTKLGHFPHPPSPRSQMSRQLSQHSNWPPWRHGPGPKL